MPVNDVDLISYLLGEQVPLFIDATYYEDRTEGCPEHITTVGEFVEGGKFDFEIIVDLEISRLSSQRGIWKQVCGSDILAGDTMILKGLPQTATDWKLDQEFSTVKAL